MVCQTSVIVWKFRVKILEIIRAHFDLSAGSWMIYRTLAASSPPVSDYGAAPCGHTSPCAPTSRASECGLLRAGHPLLDDLLLAATRRASRNQCRDSAQCLALPPYRARWRYRARMCAPRMRGTHTWSFRCSAHQSPYHVRICGSFFSGQECAPAPPLPRQP
jgi:hypothetical protein